MPFQRAVGPPTTACRGPSCWRACPRWPDVWTSSHLWLDSDGRPGLPSSDHNARNFGEWWYDWTQKALRVRNWACTNGQYGTRPYPCDGLLTQQGIVYIGDQLPGGCCLTSATLGAPSPDYHADATYAGNQSFYNYHSFAYHKNTTGDTYFIRTDAPSVPWGSTNGKHDSVFMGVVVHSIPLDPKLFEVPKGCAARPCGKNKAAVLHDAALRYAAPL